MHLPTRQRTPGTDLGTGRIPGEADSTPTGWNRSTYAFRTLPADRHRVHTRTCLLDPVPVEMWTRRRFGNQRLRVLLCAWLTLLPLTGPLLHT